MRGIEIFQKPSYREISPMQDRPMRGPPVLEAIFRASILALAFSSSLHFGKSNYTYLLFSLFI